MYKSFSSLDALFDYMREDKEWDGAETTHRNRYPLRFVLFENFSDFSEFIVNRPEGVFTFSIKDLLSQDHPDLFPTYTQLSQLVKDYVKYLPANDYIIYPFSEMTRFYEPREFMTLVKTMKAYSPPAEGQAEKVRVYIPIVGMQGKMSVFMEDNHTYVWEYKSPRENSIYNLIIAPGSTYGISGLEQKYSVVSNLGEWLKLWEKGEAVKRSIICTSKTIFANAVNAQPDNAFQYTECTNAYELLTNGLKLDFGGIAFNEADIDKWERLAGLIDIENFDFHAFINERFDTFKLKTSADFIKTWFECESDFDRWLLAIYFRKVNADKGYVCAALSTCENLSTSELFSNIATLIFDVPFTDDNIKERREALKEAAKHGVKITDAAEHKVYAKLSAMMAGEPEARYNAVKLMTAFTESDRRLVIESLGRGILNRSDVERIYPGVYHYMTPLGIQLASSNQWIAKYIDAYRASKIADNADEVQPLLLEVNASPATFQHWTDNLKTVKTQLHNRPDIDVYYWIDGLGIDWIPFITQIIKKHNRENVYLNEVYIARAALPTTTAVNKPKLQELIPEGKLQKIGDLDSNAHASTSGYPQYIIEEMDIVEKAVTNVLSQYNGKKIAFVSDHGLTYMAQYGVGLNLAGIESNHEGRVAKRIGAPTVGDNKFILLDDGNTLCPLTDDSLSAKTHKGHGAHGGATPEEVLVPILIVSSQPNASVYSADLIENEIDGTNPVVKLSIRGLNSVDVPVVEYNNSTYCLIKESGDIFSSEKLNLVDTATKFTLNIGHYAKTFSIKISTGASEADDLFDF